MLEKKSLKTSSVIQKWRHSVRGEGVPKISDKKWHRGRGYMQIKNANKKSIYFSGDDTHHQNYFFIFFIFLLVFGKHGSSWALISIPLLVSFQVLAWVVVTSLYPPFSKDNDWVSLCILSENMHNKIFIKTTFESHPASFLQGCWKRWIWSWKCWRDGRSSSYFWQTMFNSLYESASDGHVWKHLWVKESLVKSFHLLLYCIK